MVGARLAIQRQNTFAAGSAATGTYRGLKLWEAAVKEAGKVDREGVAAALDHAADAGVEVLVYRCEMGRESIRLTHRIPWRR